MEDNLFSIDRERYGGWISLSYKFFMSNYPHFDELPKYTFCKEGTGLFMSPIST